MGKINYIINHILTLMCGLSITFKDIISQEKVQKVLN